MTSENTTIQHGILTTAHNDYEKGLNAYAFYKLNSHETGEDLVQITFLKTWKYLVRGGKIDLMKAFLYHILNHLIIDEYRKHKTTSLDLMLVKGFEPSVGDPASLSNILSGKMAFLLIQRLPEKYQKVMHMRYIQGLSLKEISLILGQTKNAVTVQAYRGLLKLRKLYNHE
jgi:RNA polymerase sigma-70 factor (ECF subfamily)